jgi:hypothetical protein
MAQQWVIETLAVKLLIVAGWILALEQQKVATCR